MFALKYKLVTAVMMVMVLFLTVKHLEPIIAVENRNNQSVIQTAILNQNVFMKKKQTSEFLSSNYIPSLHVNQISCKALAEGDKSEIMKAEEYQLKKKLLFKPGVNISHLATDCNVFIKSRHYAMRPLSDEEANFSIAYSIMMFKDPEQVERLLRAIYRPQNYYCIHIDSKASKEIFTVMKSLVKCFENVFLASRSVDVQWGWYSVLEPEIVCMDDLWNYKKWKYIINLTGQEFPLQTNLDIVKILKAFNGANHMEGTVKRRNKERTQYVYPEYKKRKGPPPINVTISKGAVHIIAKRGFVDYVLHNEKALAFRNWVKDTGHPDETFFNSLNNSPQLNVPGAYKGVPETDTSSLDDKSPKNPFIARFKNWGSWKCHGKFVRSICVFGVGDLQLLVNRKELFANKFHTDYHPLVYDCLEEIYFNRTRDETLGTRIFNTSFYDKLDIVNNHVA